MSTIILVIAAVAAAYTDLRWRKIPNALVVAFVVIGVVLQFAQSPYAGVTALIAGAIALLIGTFAFAVRLMGGGDVKFLVAAVVALGAADGARFFVYTLVCGGILAIVVSISRGSFSTMLANVRASALTLTAPAGSGRMPYALAMLGGAMTLVAAETLLPALRFPL